MYQDMLCYLETSVRNICGILERFENDQEELNRRFFRSNPCHGIEMIGGGDSDAHKGGLTVHIIELDNGEKLVYKPRSLAVDHAFRAFLQWSCDGIGETYWWNPVWNRGEYGWCGWVTALPCHSYKELKHYYRRNGILLGLGRLLGSRDLHYENIIAHGEYPIIVDLEMVIGGQGAEEASGGGTDVECVFRESVLRTGILPTYAWDAMGKGINVGAINGMGGQVAPFLVPVIVNPGTVRMHVEYRQPETKQGKNQWISVQEVAELERGDIPYFWYQPDKLNLYSGTGEELKGYFQVTAIACIRSRLNRMSRADLTKQRKLIRIALLTGNGSKNVLSLETGISDVPGRKEGNVNQQSGLRVADRIGKLLLEEAVWSDVGRDAGWISIIMARYQEQSYLIRPMGLYLYDGLAGVAIFMQRLGIRTGEKCYQDMAELLEYLYLQCEAVSTHLDGDRNYDVLGGNAGAILVFLGAYEMTGNRQYILWAKKAGECLLETAESFSWGLGWRNPVLQIPLTGFAHGASGIMLAMVKLGYYTREEKYYHAANQAFWFEEHYYDAEIKDWLDLRNLEGEKQQKHKMAWCHGWGGIVMARRIAEKYAEGALKEALAKAVDFVREKESEVTFGDAYCLCHGNCGNAALYYGNQNVKGQELMEMAIDKLGEAEEIRDCLGIQECGNFGLMGGITGIGYGCLCGVEECAGILGIEISNII